MENLDVSMMRPKISELPVFPLPDGYAVRWYRPGDEDAWRTIQAAADEYNDISPELFREQYGHDEKALAQRMAFLCDRTGEPVGTATAWTSGSRGGDWCRVHWVAIVPAHQGKGLAKPLLAAVLERAAALGHTRVYLTTSTARIPAIHLYLNFGFVPENTGPEAEAAWRLVAAELPHDALASYRL